LNNDKQGNQVFIFDISSRKHLLLCKITTQESSSYLIPNQFVDNDTFEGFAYNTELQFCLQTFHRRFPEWWWGHFYRPEVWLAIGLSVLLIWRAARSRRAPVTRSSGLRVPAT